jgi:acetyl-CoA synthetase
MDSEDPLSSSILPGRQPNRKGFFTTAGYMVGTSHHRWVFDIKEESVYWCTADIGWVTGHS